MSDNVSGTSQIVLPAGVSVGPGRQTSQTNAQGGVDQGLSFTLNFSDGTVSSVFVPYSVIHNTTAVQMIFNKRIAAVQAITTATS